MLRVNLVSPIKIQTLLKLGVSSKKSNLDAIFYKHMDHHGPLLLFSSNHFVVLLGSGPAKSAFLVFQTTRHARPSFNPLLGSTHVS